MRGDASRDYGRLSPSQISRLLHMGRLESQIAIWRMGLKPHQRDSWNSPATICKRCPEVRTAIEEANKDKPARAPRPRPTADPRDELEHAVNRVFDLVGAIDDVDLRGSEIDRLITLLRELREPERTQPKPIPEPPKPTGKRSKKLQWKQSKGKGPSLYSAADGNGGEYLTTVNALAGPQVTNRFSLYHRPRSGASENRCLGRDITLKEVKRAAEGDRGS